MRKLVLVLILFLVTVSAKAQQAFMGPVPVAQTSLALPTVTQVRTVLIPHVAGKFTYITSWRIIPASGAVVTWTHGTGTNCGTNPIVLDDPDTYGTVLQPDNYGSAKGALLIAPQGADICLTVSTAAIAGSVTYGQF